MGRNREWGKAGNLCHTVWSYLRLDNRDLRTRIRQTPLVALKHAPEERNVRLHGVVHYGGEPLVAPLSRRECAAWRVVVLKRSEDMIPHWDLLSDRSRCQGFLLQDGQFRARVAGNLHRRHHGDEANASLTVVELLLDYDAKSETSRVGGHPPELTRYLRSRGHRLRGYGGLLRYRVFEGVLAAGERAAVVGRGRWRAENGIGPQTYRQAMRRFEFRAGADGRILASDERGLTSPSAPSGDDGDNEEEVSQPI